MATSDTKLTMKLLIDTKSRKVLFAEAESNCVDFLFNILLLPVGTVIRLLKEKGMNGCLPNLYESVETLNETYIQSNRNKDILLKPKSPPGISSVPFLLLNNVTSAEKTFYSCCISSVPFQLLDNVKFTQKTFYSCRAYGCSNGTNYVTDDPSVGCPNCRRSMGAKLTYVGKQGVSNEVVAPAKGGFVKEVVTYMVMDDLVVKPMSTISSIALLNKFNVRDISVLQEEVVNFGMEEALELLKASFESKSTVLTSVFMSRITAEI